MPDGFKINAQINLLPPTLSNVEKVRGFIASNLKNVRQEVEVQAKGIEKVKQVKNEIRDVARNVSAASSSTRKFSEDLRYATVGIDGFGRQAALALRKIAAFSVGTITIVRLASAFSQAVDEAFSFEKQLIKIGQVIDQPLSKLGDITNTINKLGIGLGVSRTELLDVAQVLFQAGKSVEEVKKQTELLAKVSLSATFGDIKQSTEGLIAVQRQFNLSTDQTAQAFDVINSVSKKFAVESGDLITAIQKAGGAFRATSNQFKDPIESLSEFLSLITAVRSSTRESADTIATGFRTIFPRLQRKDTVDFFKSIGVELRDLDGQFVGGFEAIKRISQALSTVPTTSSIFAEAAEQIGGLRQESKTIPLLLQSKVAQEALNVARKSGNSIDKDAIAAQEGLANQFRKVREEFFALIKEVEGSKTFKTFAETALLMARALIKVGDALRPILPLLATLGAIKASQALKQFSVGALSTFNDFPVAVRNLAQPRKFATGGLVPGQGSGDTVPAMLTPGEFVLRKDAVKNIGLNNIQKMASGGSVKGRGYSTQPIRSGDIIKGDFEDEFIHRFVMGTQDINTALASNDYSYSGYNRKFVQNFIANIRKRATPLRDDKTLFSGVGRRTFNDIIQQVGPLSNKSVGKKFTLKRFLSTSAREEEAASFFGGKGLLELFVPKNKKVLQIGDYVNQAEFVIPNSNVYEIIKPPRKYDPDISEEGDILSRMNLGAYHIPVRALNSGGLVQKFASGGLAKRLFGKNDDFIIKNSAPGNNVLRVLKNPQTFRYPNIKQRLLDFIPEGSQYLDSGTEAVVVKTPQGTVIRIGPSDNTRPNISTMLQASKSKRIGPFLVEELPFAETFTGKNSRITKKRFNSIISGLRQRSIKEGYYPDDLHIGNIGRINKRIKFIDPGTLSPTSTVDSEDRRFLESIIGLKMAKGGNVGGIGNQDTVPALLTPGEFVLNKDAVARIGVGRLNQLNKVQKFAHGGKVRDPITGRFATAESLAPTRGTFFNEIFPSQGSGQPLSTPFGKQLILPFGEASKSIEFLTKEVLALAQQMRALGTSVVGPTSAFNRASKLQVVTQQSRVPLLAQSPLSNFLEQKQQSQFTETEQGVRGPGVLVAPFNRGLPPGISGLLPSPETIEPITLQNAVLEEQRRKKPKLPSDFNPVELRQAVNEEKQRKALVNNAIKRELLSAGTQSAGLTKSINSSPFSLSQVRRGEIDRLKSRPFGLLGRESKRSPGGLFNFNETKLRGGTSLDSNDKQIRQAEAQDKLTNTLFIATLAFSTLAPIVGDMKGPMATMLNGITNVGSQFLALSLLLKSGVIEDFRKSFGNVLDGFKKGGFKNAIPSLKNLGVLGALTAIEGGNQLKASSLDKIRSGNFAGTKESAALGGAISGAGIGAAGFLVPVVGPIVGTITTLGGALIGFAKSLDEAKIAIETSQLIEKFKTLGSNVAAISLLTNERKDKQIDITKKQTSDLFKNLSRIEVQKRKNFEEDVINRGNARNSQAPITENLEISRQFIRDIIFDRQGKLDEQSKELQQLAPQDLQNFLIDLVPENVTNAEDAMRRLEKELGLSSTELSTALDKLGISGLTIRNIFTERGVKIERNLSIFNNSIEAFNQAKALETFSESVQRQIIALDGISETVDAITGNKNNFSQLRSVAAIGTQKTATQGQQNDFLQFTKQFAPELASDVAKNITLKNAIPKILGQLSQENVPSEDIGFVLQSRLGGQVGGISNLPGDIKNTIKSLFPEDDTKKSREALQDLARTAESLASSLPDVEKAAIESGEAVFKTADKFRELNDLITRGNLDIARSKNEGLSLGIETELKRREITGLGTGNVQGNLFKQQLGNILGVGGIGLTGPAGLTKIIQQAQGQVQEFGQKPDLTSQNIVAAANRRIVAATEGLQFFAQNTTLASDALAKLDEATQAKNVKRGILEQAVTGTASEKRDLARNLFAARAITANPENINALPPELQKAGLGILQQFGKSQVFGSDKQANKVIEEALTAGGKKLGLPPEAFKELFGVSDKEQEQLDTLQKIRDDQIIAIRNLSEINGHTGALQEQVKNTEGLLPRATGGAIPGVGNSDSVPALLTPGEFVIRKSAVRDIGLSTLNKLNRQGRVGFQDGGLVQGNTINFDSGSINRFELAISNFSTSSAILSRALDNFPRNIEMNNTGRIEVIFNGATSLSSEILSRLQPAFESLVKDQVTQAINGLRKEFGLLIK